MKKILFSILAVATILTLSAPISWAWQKDSGATCARVFASIQNENISRDWTGTVKANGVFVVNTSGTATSTEWVTVEWIPTPGFSGSVEAKVTLLNNGDSNTKTENLNCPTPTPTVTPTATPTPSQTPSSTPTLTPTPTTNPCPNGCGGGPGDGLSDGRSDGRSDGKSDPIKAVLGLSTTSGNSGLIVFAQIVAAFTLSIVAFKFLKKNA